MARATFGRTRSQEHATTSSAAVEENTSAPCNNTLTRARTLLIFQEIPEENVHQQCDVCLASGARCSARVTLL